MILTSRIPSCLWSQQEHRRDFTIYLRYFFKHPSWEGDCADETLPDRIHAAKDV